MIWIGADPGGIGNFGAAILFEDSSYCCKDVNSVSEFIAFIEEQPCFRNKGQVPNAIGIDAPLWWSTRVAGARDADIWIRQNYNVGNSVSSINSLRGAALIQGVVLALELRRQFPGLAVTETHPKALLKAMYENHPIPENNFFNRYPVRGEAGAEWKTEHQRDALISAICARETFEGRWALNLAPTNLDLLQPNRHPTEVSSGIVDVRYGWPPI